MNKKRKIVNFWENPKPVNVYGNLVTINLLKKRFDYCFKKIGMYPPIVKANLVKKSFSLGRSNEKIFFSTIQAKHGDVYVTGYIFNKTAYLSDCNDSSIVKNKKLKDLNYLIIDCLRKEGGPAHFGLNDCLYINKILTPKKMILTNLHYSLDYKILKKNLPRNIIPAFDGLEIVL